MPLVYESGNASNSACFKPLALGDPPFIVSFYRSQDHAGTVNNRGKVNCNYGAADSYKGEFGFDFFDKEVIAEGLSQHYKMLSGIEKADETFGDSKAYLCPYLSIWPPQVDGNMKDKKSTVTLYARLERSSEYDKNDKNLPDNLDVKIVSTDGEVITINSKENNGNSEDTVNLKLEDTLVSITIECKKPFGEEKEVAILAKTRYKKEGSMDVVGKVILYPNAVRYKTTIQPVRINFTAAESSVIKTEPTIELIKDVADAFNTVSFNQAYIHADVEPTMEVVEFAKSQFQTKGEEIIVHKQQPEIIGTGLHDYLEYDEAQVIPNKYNNLVENRYAALAAKQKDSFAKNKAGEDLTLKMQNLLTQFDKYFSYKATGNPIKIRNKKEKMIVKTAWEKPKVQAAYKEYLASRAAYDKILVSSEGLDKTHKIHVFFTSDLFAGRTDDGEVLAYSSRGSGVVHIFNKALTDKDALDTILHEMAHSLGLEHPFDEEANKPYAYKEKGKHYKEDVEKKIDKLEQQIKDYKIKIKDTEKILSYVEKGDIKLVEAYVERKIFYKWQWDKIRQTGKSQNYLLEEN